MFGAVTSTLGKIFGTDKALTSMVDGVKSGLDKLVYTGQEKAEDVAKAVTEARAMLVAWMDATKGQNIARRIIALSIVFTWLAQYMSMCLLSVASVWFDLTRVIKVNEKEIIIDPLIQSANIIGGFADKMSGAVMLILGFYFAAPYMEPMVKGAMDKFKGTK